MKDELVLAPSAGRSRVRSNLYSIWLGQHLSRLTGQHDAIGRLIVGSKIIHKTRPCLDRGQEVRRTGISTAFTRNRSCLGLSDTVTHCPRYQSSVQYTYKMFSHPPLPLIQCSNSTLFCNIVTQSHQLFIKDFCTWLVRGLMDGEIQFQGEVVKYLYNYPKSSIKLYI